MGLDSPRSHLFRDPRRVGAFTLIEILIVVVILGILASIVIPQFSNASHEAREAMLKDDLRFLRTQITVFKAEHRDVSPGYPAGDPAASATEADFTAQMTGYTDTRCAVSVSAQAGFPFGPYLEHVPVNPINGRDTMLIVGPGTLPSSASGTYGWVYQPSSLTILSDATGADASGKNYFAY